MLNMREKSEMQSHLAANMCKLEHSVPSRSVESEPENVLNTLSPGRCSRWILPEELETPDRPTSSGLQSPVGVPVQLGPSRRHENTVILVHVVYLQLNGEICMLEREREREKSVNCLEMCLQVMNQVLWVIHSREERTRMSWIRLQHCMQLILLQRIYQVRDVSMANLMRPRPAEEETPSTACRPNVVNAPGGVALGRGPPGFGTSPGSIPSRQIAPPPPPPPPPPAPVPHGHAISSAATYPMEWTPLHTRPKASGGGGPPDGPGGGTGTGMGDHSNPSNNPYPGGGSPGSSGSGGAQPPRIQEAIQAAAAHLQVLRPHSSQEEQAIPVALRQPHLQGFLTQEDTPIHGRP